MPQLLAIEWDSSEARLAVAQRHGRRVVIEHAFSVELGPRQTGKKETAPDIGARLSAALASRGIRQVQTLAAVGRTSIELKLMSLPPAPDEELPDIVRFQAQRDFSSLGADCVVDYIPLSGDEQSPHAVLAGAISRELVDKILQTCQSANLKARRLVLRSCAAASLLRRQKAQPGERVRLLVDLVANEVDVTALVADNVVYMRTVRLPDYTDGEARRHVLLGEIRRTMAAVQNQLGGDRVDAIYICGKEEDHAELLEQVGRELDIPGHAFDPFGGLELGEELLRHQPERGAQFAPLLGMLLDEAEDKRHAIDFLNPRRKATSSSQKRAMWIAGAAALLLVAFGVVRFWLGLSGIENDIASAESTLQEYRKQAKQIDESIKRSENIRDWLASDLNWLDQMYDLSASSPPSKDVMLTDLVFRAGQRAGQTGGSVEVKGVVRDMSIIDNLESDIDIEESRPAEQNPKYPIGFVATRRIAPDAARMNPRAPATTTKSLEEQHGEQAAPLENARKKDQKVKPKKSASEEIERAKAGTDEVKPAGHNSESEEDEAKPDEGPANSEKSEQRASPAKAADEKAPDQESQTVTKNAEPAAASSNQKSTQPTDSTPAEEPSRSDVPPSDEGGAPK